MAGQHPAAVLKPRWTTGFFQRLGKLLTEKLFRVRDWRVRTKLAAVLLIPAVALAVVAGMRITASVQQARALDQLAAQVALGEQVNTLVHELQLERDRLTGTLARYASSEAEPGSAELAELVADGKALSAATAAFHQAVEPLRGRPQLRDALARAESALAGLSLVHVGLQKGWLDRRALFDGYSRAIDALLAVQSAPSGVDAVEVRGYQSLSEYKETVAQLRGQVLVVVSAGKFELGESERLADLRAQRRAAQDRFRSNATRAQLAHFDEVVRGQAVRASSRVEQEVLAQATAGVPVRVDPEQWWTVATTELELLKAVERTLWTDLSTHTRQASGDQWRGTILVTAIVLLILVVSLLASVGIGRSMARSLRQLRRQAMQVANEELPGLLERLRDTRRSDSPGEPQSAVTVPDKDEIGDVAEAFGQVHRAAVRLAVEQALMRRHQSEIFVNLARRSQSLVERQLELLDDLEREEVEPTQLANLFRLDHLATRMRRNNQSLLVLAASDPARRFDRPVPLAAVALAASSEIEQYERVRVEVGAGPHVVGHAAADLAHLLAELLDNAASFSPPSTTVQLCEQRLPAPAGLLVQITDAGIGMSPSALADANALLARPAPVDVAASERMGLVVVSHLAARHGVRVTLHAAAPGVRVEVWLPDTVLAAAPDEPADADPAQLVTARRRPARKRQLSAESAKEETVGGWWSQPEQPRPPERPRPGTPASPDALATGGARPRPGPATSSGTGPGGLPVRVPMAQLPPDGPGRTAGRPAPAWEPNPEQVGGVLSRFYGGVRRAESEPVDDSPTQQISLIAEGRPWKP